MRKLVKIFLLFVLLTGLIACKGSGTLRGVWQYGRSSDYMHLMNNNRYKVADRNGRDNVEDRGTYNLADGILEFKSSRNGRIRSFKVLSISSNKIQLRKMRRSGRVSRRITVWSRVR